MFVGAGQEKTALIARSFVIWREELSKKGRYAAAEKLYQRALGLVEGTLGQQHLLTAEVAGVLRRAARKNQSPSGRDCNGKAARKQSGRLGFRIIVFVALTSRSAHP
jgi:hypothetical protein